LAAQDPVLGGVDAGVDFSEIRMDAGSYATYTSTLSLSEGRHLVDFRSHDHVGNVETAQMSQLYVDGTPPKTSVAFTGASYQVPNSTQAFVAENTRIELTALDVGVDSTVVSGLSATYVSI